MRKLLSIVGILFLVGCGSNNLNMEIDKQLKEANLNKMLIDKYHITSDSLISFNNVYLFTSPSANGTDIVFLNKNYKEIKKVSIPYFDAKKIAVSKDKIYVFGTDEKNYYPKLVILDSKGNILKSIIIPKKYALSKDIYLNKGNNYLLIDVYDNGKSYIEIYKNGKLIKKIELKNSINGNFVFKVNNDLFVIGTIKNNDEDAFIMNVTKGWIRSFDLGMDESFTNYKIEKNKIILNLHSTDEMGADSDYEIIIDLNGKILKNKCKVKFDPLPIKFRT